MGMSTAKIILGLFAAPFLGVGLWAGYSLATSLVEWNQMKSWVPATAMVSKGGVESESGSDATTYRAYAEYTYTYLDHTYRGSRVAINNGHDNVGDFQRDLGHRLAQAANSASGLEIYINPADPAESIVNRGLRWGIVGLKSLIVLLFGGFGLLLFIGIFRASDQHKALPAETNNEHPWLVNKAWRTPKIDSLSKPSMYTAWFITVIWNAVSAPLPYMVYNEVLTKRNWPALLGILFPLVGLGLLIWAVKRTLEWKKFGHAPVELDPFPGSIGGHVGGIIDLKYPFKDSVQYIVTLTNIHHYEHRNGDERSHKEVVLWQDAAVAYAEKTLQGTRLVFRFDVPENLQPSDAKKDGGNHYLWRLNLKGDLPGVDVDHDYEIPVYPTHQHAVFLPFNALTAFEQAHTEIYCTILWAVI